MKLRSFAVLLICASTTASGAPQTEAAWECRFNSRTLCGPTTCKVTTNSTATTWIYLAPNSRDYWRCDGSDFANCDKYKANVFDSGAFKVFELTGHAGYVKVGEDLEATETLSQMDLVYINRGRCMSAPPPLTRLDR